MRVIHNGFANNFGLVGKNLRHYLTTTALTATGLMALAAPASADNWTDHVADEGLISIDTSIPDTTSITQGTDFVKVHGDGDINAGWTVNVAQPSSSSKYVLYDIENDPTEIMGALNANGKVYIFDKNGVIFGKNSQVNVGSISASTGTISDEDLKADKLNYTNVSANGAAGTIQIKGKITAGEAGLAAFVAPGVSNSGVIDAKVVIMASGDKVAVDMYGDNLVSVEVGGALKNALVENSGTIRSNGGTVVMTAQAAKDAVDNVINMDGVVDVSSVSVKGGKIVLSGGSKGVVKVSGALKANGKDGGAVKVTGQNIHVTETSTISANALTAGNGGVVDLVADNGLVFGGKIEAKGGVLAGNGGAVDTSGKDWVDIYGTVDAAAYNGANGTWTIDPSNLRVVSTSTSNATTTNPFTPTVGAGTSRVLNTVINTALDSGTDVTITTISSPNKPFQDGTISFEASLTKTVAGVSTLFVNAVGSILSDAASTISATVGVLNVVFDAVKNILLSGDIKTNGGDAAMTAQTGNFTLFGGGLIDTSASSGVGGDITVNADGAVTTFFGVPITGTLATFGVLNAGGGDITLHQSAVFDGDADSIRTSGNGKITMNQNKVNSYGSIQDAIDALANTGTGQNTISVGAGTYNESLVTTQDGLLLKGANYGKAGNDVTRTAESILKPNSPGVDVQSDYFTIDGFTIDGADNGVESIGNIETAVYNNIIKNSNLNGVYLKDIKGQGVGRNKIDGTVDGDGIHIDGGTWTINVFGNEIGKDGDINGNGIYLTNLSDANVWINFIYNTKVNVGDDASGIYLKYVTDSRVGGFGAGEGNIIRNTQWDGVKVFGGEDNTVEHNDIKTTTRVGVYGEATSQLIINKNKIVDSNIDERGAITVLGGINHTITNNDVTGNTSPGNSDADAGIYISEVFDGGINKIIGNIIHHIKGDGIIVRDVKNIDVNENIISDTDGLGSVTDTHDGDGISIADTTGVINVLNNIIGVVDGVTKIVGNGVYMSGLNSANGAINVNGNQIFHTLKVGDGDNANGIYLADVTGATVGVEGNGNYIRNADWDGIKSRLGGNNLIQWNDIANITRVGIFGEYSQALTILNNLVYDSNLEGWGGITVLFNGGHTINYNTVHNNIGVSTGDHGIYLALDNGSGAHEIMGNTVYDIADGSGITARDLYSNVTINNNKIDNIADNGVNVYNFTTATINGNDIDDVGGNGIYANNGDYVDIELNNGSLGDGIGISNADKHGIHVEYVDVSYIGGNVIDFSGIDGIHVNNFFSTDIIGNTISRSGDDGIEAVFGSLVNINGNNVSQSGIGTVIPDEDPEDYEDAYDEFYAGNDGIHVAYINGYYEDEYYYPGAVNIVGNTINTSGDDGIEVNDIDGYAYIANNSVFNSGYGGGGDYDDSDYYGADGIHVRNVYGYPPYFDDEVILGLAAEGAGNVGDPDTYAGFTPYGDIDQDYSVVVYNNNVHISGDDGIQVHNEREEMEYPDYEYGRSLIMEEGDGHWASVLVDSNENVSNSVNHGLYISGPSQPGVPGSTDYKVIVSNNNFSNFDIGAEFESGLIDLTGASNTFDNGRVGLKFTPYDYEGEELPGFAKISLYLTSVYLDLIDDDGPGSTPYPDTPTNFGGTIGAQTFTNISQYYVELEDGAMTNDGTPIWLNGLNSSYDGFTPADFGGAVPQSIYDILEAKFYHFPDEGDRDIFWFGFPVPDSTVSIDQSDLFNRFDPFNGDITGLNVRILGLPRLPGQGGAPSGAAFNNIQTFAGGPTDPASLNNIQTAAGGDGTAGQNNTAENLANINTEAGGENASCWSDAASAAAGGQAVNVVYNGSFDANLEQAANCGTAF